MTAVGGEQPTSTRGTRSVWRRALVATAGLWVITMLVVVVATGALPAHETTRSLTTDFPGVEAPAVDAAGLELLGSGLVRFDALWYLSIAERGYPASATVPQAAAFFPGYPLVVAGLGPLTGGNLPLAAQLVAFAATVAAAAGLQRLAGLVLATNGRVGRTELPSRVLLLTLAFPTAFFLLAPYAESLLLAASVWALVHAARGSPWRSAALAAVASTVRPVGVLLAVPLLLGVLGGNRRADGWWRDPLARAGVLRDAVLPALGSVTGLAAVAVHSWVRWGEPLGFATAQAGWQREAVLPLLTLWHGVRYGLRALVDGSTPYHLLDLVVFVLTAVAVIALLRRREWPLATHAIVSVLLWLSQPFTGRPLMSTPRFALAVPGIMLGLALAASSHTRERILLATCSVLFVLHLVLFTRWWFVF